MREIIRDKNVPFVKILEFTSLGVVLQNFGNLYYERTGGKGSYRERSLCKRSMMTYRSDMSIVPLAKCIF